MIKNFVFILVLGLLSISCTTTEKIISKNKLKVNMSKLEFGNVFKMSYINDDPIVTGGSEVYAGGYEILWAKNKKKFFVFENVSIPKSCGFISCNEGNGKLKSWHNNIQDARLSITQSAVDQNTQNE